MKTPKRSYDTMSDAIALSSPNGRMSKRAKSAATDRLCQNLFGVPEKELTLEFLKGERKESVQERCERMRNYAKYLRQVAAGGMQTRKLNKEADRLEAEAALLSANPPNRTEHT